MGKLILLMCAVLLLYTPVAAVGPQIGVGVFGGLDQPVGLDDQKQGTVFGIRGKVKLIPVVTFEPYLSFSSFGDPELEDIDLSGMEGSKVNAYGVDATLGAPFGAKGFAMFGIVGAGFYNLKNDQRDEDDTNLGWSAGLGFGIGFAPMVSVDVRGKLNVIPYDDGGSFKSVSATAGVNYYFGM